MLVRHDIRSLYLGTTRGITVLLPPGYNRYLSRTRYPVLYLNDGLNLFEPSRAFARNTWRAPEIAANLLHRRRIPPILIVGIDHGVVAREVLPFMARSYPIARGTAATGIGGSS